MVAGTRPGRLTLADLRYLVRSFRDCGVTSPKSQKVEHNCTLEDAANTPPNRRRPFDDANLAMYRMQYLEPMIDPDRAAMVALDEPTELD